MTEALTALIAVVLAPVLDELDLEVVLGWLQIGE
jgi:hypothetical protein